jgi:hypothetical protein
MGDTINLPVDITSDMGRALVADLSRFSEGSLTEAQVRRKHHFDDATWEALADHEKLLEAVEAEKLRRIRNGAAKREKAQRLVVPTVDILSNIATDPTASPRHRVDAIKTLDSFAESGPKEGPAAADTVFLIRIDLSGGPDGDPRDVFERTVLTKPTGEPQPDAGSAPQKMIEAKKEDDSDAEPVRKIE